MRVLAAIGGNALLERGESPDAVIQERHVAVAVGALSRLARDEQLVVTHGNGPQVGLLALESAADPALTRPYPLDVLGAQTQGMIGYWLVQGFGNVVGDREVAALITQTLVSADDPGFAAPSKFIGRVYTETEAHELAGQRGWTVKADGPAWRRVVASPAPVAVVEVGLVRRLLDAGAVVICAGGGGAPVVRDASGRLAGVDAVVDKDAVAGLIAEAVGADMLLLLTDVAAVESGYGTPDARVIGRASPAELRSQSFADGSMGPKVAAVCRFAERTGRPAAIGALGDVEAILSGDAGTIVTPDGTFRRPQPGGRSTPSRAA